MIELDGRARPGSSQAQRPVGGGAARRERIASRRTAARHARGWIHPSRNPIRILRGAAGGCQRPIASFEDFSRPARERSDPARIFSDHSGLHILAASTIGSWQDRFGPWQPPIESWQDRFGPWQPPIGPWRDRFRITVAASDPDPGRIVSDRGSPSDRTLAGSFRTVAASDRTLAGSFRTVAASDRTLAGSFRTLAASDRTLAGSFRTVAASDRTLARDRFGPWQPPIGPWQDRFGPWQLPIGPCQDRFGPWQPPVGPGRISSDPLSFRRATVTVGAYSIVEPVIVGLLFVIQKIPGYWLRTRTRMAPPSWGRHASAGVDQAGEKSVSRKGKKRPREVVRCIR